MRHCGLKHTTIPPWASSWQSVTEIQMVNFFPYFSIGGQLTTWPLWNTAVLNLLDRNKRDHKSRVLQNGILSMVPIVVLISRDVFIGSILPRLHTSWEFMRQPWALLFRPRENLKHQWGIKFPIWNINVTSYIFINCSLYLK
jgi:hypothetical protein